MWDQNPIDEVLTRFLGVLDQAIQYLEPHVFGLYDMLMLLGIVALSVFLLRGGREYFERLGPRVLYLGALGFILENFTAVSGAIVNTFVFLGLAAGGHSLAEYTFWHPGLLAQAGWEAAEPLRAEAAKLSFLSVDSAYHLLWLGVAAFLLKLSFDIMAVAVLVAIIAFKVGSLVAFVLAAAAAVPRLAWIASGAFGFVMSAAVGLFSYAVIISVVMGLTQSVFASPGLDVGMKTSVAITTAVINFGLVLLGPSIIRSVMSGVANMGLGAAATAVGSAAMMLAVPVAGGIGAARATANIPSAADVKARLEAARSASGSMPSGITMKASAAQLAGGANRQTDMSAWLPKQQRALPVASQGTSAIHVMRALTPDGTDQGGGMMAPANPERS